MLDYSRWIISAYRAWITERYAGKPAELAAYLYQEVTRSPPSGSLAWDILRATGDQEYTPETFKKAAELLLSDAPIPEEIPDEE